MRAFSRDALSGARWLKDSDSVPCHDSALREASRPIPSSRQWLSKTRSFLSGPPRRSGLSGVDARKVALYEQGFDGEIYSGSLYWAQLRWREAAGRRLTGVLTGKLIVFEDGE